jgi:hypothetical protein
MPTRGAGASDEDIRRRAYEIYVDRSRRGATGNPVDDWVQAEKELKARRPR